MRGLLMRSPFWHDFYGKPQEIHSWGAPISGHSAAPMVSVLRADISPLKRLAENGGAIMAQRDHDRIPGQSLRGNWVTERLLRD